MTQIAEPDRMRDLVTFARLELESGDLEPWAELIRHLGQSLDTETTLWLVYLYNEFDSFSSAHEMYRRWPLPRVWDTSPYSDKMKATFIPHMQERRNLHGGRGVIRLQDYCDQLEGGTQEEWFKSVMTEEPEANFLRLMKQVQQIWGVGRLAAFEWTEFLGKVMGWPIHAPDGQLWLSSGPRKSLQRLYGNDSPTQAQLTEYAHHCRGHLAEHGVNLAWEDFETVICDFNVMREGRYYPGRHLAALRGEIDELPEEARWEVLSVFRRMVPAPWCDIPPRIDKELMPLYHYTDRIHLPVKLGLEGVADYGAA